MLPKNRFNFPIIEAHISFPGSHVDKRKTPTVTGGVSNRGGLFLGGEPLPHLGAKLRINLIPIPVAPLLGFWGDPHHTRW